MVISFQQEREKIELKNLELAKQLQVNEIDNLFYNRVYNNFNFFSIFTDSLFLFY